MSSDTFTPAALQAPTGLTFAVNDDRSVDLSWDRVEGADAYEVHELLVDPAKTLKATVHTTTSHRPRLKGGDYRYGVKARNATEVSALSALVDVHVPRPGEHPQEPLGGSPVPDGRLPAALLDLSLWSLTLPLVDAKTGNARNVYQPDLATFADEELFRVVDGAVEYVSPVQGAKTSGSTGDVEATRCELREMNGPTRDDKADWTFGVGRKSLTCTMTCDPTGASPRKECTVGQIHDELNTPPIRLAVNMNDEPGVLEVHPRGQKTKVLLTGLEPTTVFTYRIRVEDDRCDIWAAAGTVDALPSDPGATYAKEDLKKTSGDDAGKTPGKCYFKAGAYNLSPVEDKKTGKAGSGRSVVRHLLLDLE